MYHIDQHFEDCLNLQALLQKSKDNKILPKSELPSQAAAERHRTCPRSPGINHGTRGVPVDFHSQSLCKGSKELPRVEK